VRNRQHLARRLAGVVELREEVRLRLDVERGDGVRNDVFAAKDHVSVKHPEVAQQGRELVSDQGREAARLIELVGDFLDSLPGRPCRVEAGFDIAA